MTIDCIVRMHIYTASSRYTDCPNKNANRTFGIDNFQNFKIKYLHYTENAIRFS